MAEKWLAIASIFFVAACGPRELSYKDVQAMTEDEKIAACQEAFDLRYKPVSPCSAMEDARDRQRCINGVKQANNVGLMNYVMLDCTRVKFQEQAPGPQK